jgi:hypothetical protein
MAVRLIRELGRLRPGDQGPYGLTEAKRMLDLMINDGKAIGFSLPKDFADILEPVFDQFFSPAVGADLSAEEVCGLITLERLQTMLDTGHDPHWPESAA